MSVLITWFALASFAGWVFESTWNVVRTGHWEKRGFLFGPLCPIYGVGVVTALVLFDRPEVVDGTFPAWAIFLVSMVGSAIMEYVVSVVLERLFGAVWWDYSNIPLNLNGRICLPASLLFGAAGVAVAYLVVPLAHAVNAVVPAVVFEVFALAIVFMLGIDLATTVLSLSDLMEKITNFDETIHSRADERVQQAAGAVGALPGRASERVQQASEAMRELPARAGERAQQAAGAVRSLPERVQSSRAETAARMQAFAHSLTKRQVKMLNQLRRFSSDTLRQRVSALRNALFEDSQDKGAK